MAGTCKENESGSDAKKEDRRKTVYRKKKRKTSFEMDGRCGSRPKVTKIKQWMEKMRDREKWRLIVEEAKALPGL
jgi:hypothetical protein